MWAQLRGNSQNLVKVVSGGLPRDENEQPPAIVHDTRLSAMINGGNSFGMLAMKLAVDTALAKARDGGGIAVVGTNNTASGTGALGYAGVYSRAVQWTSHAVRADVHRCARAWCACIRCCTGCVLAARLTSTWVHTIDSNSFLWHCSTCIFCPELQVLGRPHCASGSGGHSAVAVARVCRAARLVAGRLWHQPDCGASDVCTYLSCVVSPAVSTHRNHHNSPKNHADGQMACRGQAHPLCRSHDTAARASFSTPGHHCSVVMLQVGMPTEGEPLVMDMATSSTAYFALVEAQRAGRPVPDDVGFDADGRVTTDAGAILAGGAMRSFDRCGRSPGK